MMEPVVISTSKPLSLRKHKNTMSSPEKALIAASSLSWVKIFLYRFVVDPDVILRYNSSFYTSEGEAP